VKAAAVLSLLFVHLTIAFTGSIPVLFELLFANALGCFDHVNSRKSHISIA